MTTLFKIESLLAARLFLSPQRVGDRIFFLSDLSGRLSLYAMDKNGSVPEPLLPPNIALQNPTLVEGGDVFFVLPLLGKIVVMIDRDGDENYQPMFVPLDGGIPEPVFGDQFKGQQVVLAHGDADKNLAVFGVDPRTNPNYQTFLADLATRALTDLGTSIYGNFFVGHNQDYTKIVLADGYTAGDETIYLWEKETGRRRLLYGVPLAQRRADEQVALNSMNWFYFTPGDQGLIFVTSLFDDRYGLGYLRLETPAAPEPVEIRGIVQRGDGELDQKHPFKHLDGNRYLLGYNIDGASYLYEGAFDQEARRFTIERVIVGAGQLSNGVLQHADFEKATAGSGGYALAFSTATAPAQIYTLDGEKCAQITRERVLGISPSYLAPGEEASYTSFDGLRISARLYLPAPELGFEGKRPVVFYIHGGPQSQERPDFTWFSMPLIQFFTLNGFAVFVPNARGSSGYGLTYMKRVDHDWGGKDRLDHVAAFEHLRADARLELARAGVMGRSYGGYMTLTLAGRHPELWRAACDMFGPYNLFTFQQRLPETWQTYFHLAIGHPEKDKDLIAERSPNTYLHQLACPLLVIQGRNDPRVVEAESRDLVEQLRAQGKELELLVFENEGHDVIKYENKVRCYNEIVRFFVKHLKP